MSNKEKIESLLKENKQGLTIQDIADQLKISRQTTAVALAELKGEGRVTIREVGQAKLHYWKK